MSRSGVSQMSRRDEARVLIHDLFHAVPGEYDPQKRREYYLRTRELKGRPAGSPSSGGSGRPVATFSRPVQRQGVVTVNDAHARQQAIGAKLTKLRDRLGKLQARLEEIHKKAQEKDKEKASGDKKKSSSGDSKDAKPLTEAEKQKKAKDARERYKKEEKKNPSDSSVSDMTEEEVLAEIRKVKTRLKAIISDGRGGTKSDIELGA